MFSEFLPSDYAATIYYADMFRIREGIWMIMGYGKSQAGRIASNNCRADGLARDSVAIRCHKGKVEGRFDMGAVNPKADPLLFSFYELSAIAYCLSPEQTSQLFGDAPRGLRRCDTETMAAVSVTYPYPAVLAHHVFSPPELLKYSDPQRRSELFKETVEAATNMPALLLVPYMSTVEEKAALYAGFEQ